MKPGLTQFERMLGGRPSCIIVICSPPHEETVYAGAALETLRLPDHAWQPLPLVSRLGIDLLYARPESSVDPLFDCVDEPNTTIAAFTLDCEPTSASFGTSKRTAIGGVAFRFAKNRLLGKSELEPLESFITARMNAIKNALAGPKGVSGAIEEYEKLEPKAFKIFWKKYRAEQASRYPGMGWAKIECPVTLTASSCEACGQEDDSLGKGNVSMRCGRCKAVLYCGRKCQAEDWKAHKPFCSK